MTILEVQNLTKCYGETKAVDSLSFSVESGEIYALLGPNGAGKTTTIRMLATLLRPTSGDARIAGHSVLTEPEQVRANITYLPDEAGAYRGMTGHRYLDFMAHMFAKNSEEAAVFVARAERICGLGDRLSDKIGSYSRGMCRKLLLARAVMNAPKLAILDEPTSGLDVLNALEVRRMIRTLAEQEQMAFLISSHNMLEIEYVSHRVGILAYGRLLEEGTAAELKARHQSDNLEEVFAEALRTDREGQLR